MKIDDKEIVKVENEIKRIFGPPNKIVYDGVYDIRGYLNSKRIMWVLKESYGSENGYRLFEDEYWDKPEENRDKILMHMKQNLTLRRLAQISYALENELEASVVRQKVLEPCEYVNILRTIGYVNTGKKISGSSSTTSHSRLRQLYKEGGELVLNQLELYKPQIIVFAGTFNVYNEKNRFRPKGEGENIYELCGCRWGNPLIVSAYHPAARVNQDKYFESILRVRKFC